MMITSHMIFRAKIISLLPKAQGVIDFITQKIVILPNRKPYQI